MKNSHPVRVPHGGHLFPQLIMQSLYTIGGEAGQSAMHEGSVPPGHPGFGGGGGVGVGGAGEGGEGGEGGTGGPGSIVVPISPNLMSENVARCGPPASDVEVWQGPALTHLVQEFTPSSHDMPV